MVITVTMAVMATARMQKNRIEVLQNTQPNAGKGGQMKQHKLTDIHTHILPGMDDGARTLTDAVTLLRTASEKGVRQIVFTPHFYPGRETIENFLTRRKKAMEALNGCQEIKNIEICMKTGAEVRYSPAILDYDLHALCIQGTPYMLLELSTGSRPLFFEEALFGIQSQGVVPILAHVERYGYLKQNPASLAQWIDAGVLTQVNADSLGRSNPYKRTVSKFFQWNMVHLMASDTHSMDQRPPNLDAGLSQCSREMQEQLTEHAAGVFDGEAFYVTPPKYPQKRFWGWR